jgi:hypothetical protein
MHEHFLRAGLDLQLLGYCERAILHGLGLNNTVRLIREAQHEQYDKDEAIYYSKVDELGARGSLASSNKKWPRDWMDGIRDGRPDVSFPTKKEYGVACPSGVYRALT